MRGFFLFLGLAFFTVRVFSQSYLTHTYSENDGLASSTVYDVTQDSLGRMWFATRNGISIYDGSEWTTLTVKDGIPSISVYKLFFDKKGVLWLLPSHSSARISFFKQKKWQSLPTPVIPNEIIVTSFNIEYINNQLFVILGTLYNGLYIYQNQNENWVNFSTAEGLLSPAIKGVCVIESTLLVATSKGFSEIWYDTQNDKFIIQSSSEINKLLPARNLLGIACEKTSETSKIWIVGDSWMGYVFKGDFTLVVKNTPPILVNNQQNVSVLPDGHGGIYFGNTYNFFYLDEASHEIALYDRQNGLISDGATSFFIDREKVLWITSLRGVSKIPSRRFLNYRKTNGLLENEVTSVIEIEPGKLVFGHRNGITIKEKQNLRIITFLKEQYASEVETRISDFSKDRENNVWMSVSKLGIAKLTPDGEITFFNEKQGLNLKINSVLVDNNDRLWVGTQNGLFYMENNTFVEKNIPDLKKQSIRRIIQGNENAIYVLTYSKGIFRLNNNRWQNILHSHSQNVNNVYAFHRDSQGKYWVGTLGGLYTIEADSLVQAEIDSLTISRPVYAIMEDSKHRLWLGTNNGYFRWDGEHIRHFTVNNGLSGQEANRAACIEDSKGLVWLGTNMGISCYQENFDYDDSQIAPPIIIFNHLDALGTKYSLYEDVEINYNLNNLTFHFKGISFLNEASIQFQIKLDKFDPDWITLQKSPDQQIRYTNLPPGTYRLQIKAQNANGQWSDTVTSARITIKRPYWQSWWFYVLLAFGTGLFFYWVQNYYSTKRTSLILEKQVQIRTAQLQESERRYRQMFENNQAVMLLVDPETEDIIDATPAASIFYGYSPDTFKNVRFCDLNPESNNGDNGHFQLTYETDYQIMQHKVAASLVCDVEIYFCPITIQGRKMLFLIIHDITERLQAERRIKSSLREKELLLKEVHHRVKNNLQVISSLLNLQSTYIEDHQALKLFKESQNRVRSMALIHEWLYHSKDLTRINFEGYIRRLIAQLFSSYGVRTTNIRYHVKIQDILLDINRAIPCGLIVNELITNALQHAFPEAQTGEIEISLYKMDEEKYALEVHDNGIGLPNEIDFMNTQTLGLQLVVTLAEQLHGKVKVKRAQGTRFSILF